MTRAIPEMDWRREAYEGSTAFMEALAVVQHDLHQAAAKNPSDVKAFLTWMRQSGQTMSGRQIRQKIEAFHSDVIDSLRLYVGFVLRFHVYLKFIRRDGVLEFVPNYKTPLQSQLKVGVKGGKLIPPPAEPDADVRVLFAFTGGMPAEIRKGVKKKGSRILMSEQRKLADALMMGRGL